MNKNFGWKLLSVVAILFVFLYGIVGIPRDWSGKGLVSAIGERINLGLDLKGGTHLILQVQVNDAVRVDGENAVERLKEGSRKILDVSMKSSSDSFVRSEMFTRRTATVTMSAPDAS